jgi:hypothetical protein
MTSPIADISGERIGVFERTPTYLTNYSVSTPSPVSRPSAIRRSRQKSRHRSDFGRASWNWENRSSVTSANEKLKIGGWGLSQTEPLSNCTEGHTGGNSSESPSGWSGARDRKGWDTGEGRGERGSIESGKLDGHWFVG